MFACWIKHRHNIAPDDDDDGNDDNDDDDDEVEGDDEYIFSPHVWSFSFHDAKVQGPARIYAGLSSIRHSNQ